MSDFYTHTLGCKVNFADVQAVTARLRLGAGGRLSFRGGARLRLGGGERVALVGTCCVTAEAERQSRKEVRRAARRVGPEGRVFVTGCAARLNSEAFSGLGANITALLGDPGQVAAGIQARLDEIAVDEVGADEARASVAPADEAWAGDARTEEVQAARVQYGSPRTRFFLKIQDGCANRCSYCVIPQVRGKPRSIAAAELLASARELVAAGYPELVVSGINAGAWRNGEMRLDSLMEQLARIDGLARLRLSSIEATGVTPELLEVMRRHAVIGRHLHLPLQSGDDGVLAAMGRRYDTEVFAAAVSRARELLPELNLTTDVIVGFPGEDEAAFHNTRRFVEDNGFTRLHVFSYSPRPGTAAAASGDTVPPEEKKRRSAALRKLSSGLQKAHRQRKLGLASEILLESPLAPGVHGGYSSDYTRFEVSGGRPGLLVQVRGLGLSEAGVMGEVVEA